MPYHLHGICIHDGTAESGHYYSYIKDHTQDVWRRYDDHRITTVEEEQVLEEAMGGGLTKSAYYVTYLSAKEIQRTRPIDENRFDPEAADYERVHPYGPLASEESLRKIKENNRALRTEIDDYLNTEIAKKVTTLYERNYEEIKKVLDNTSLSTKNIGSIYTYLIAKPETVDLGKRYLLDHCFFVENKQRWGQMERSGGITAKIEEKSKANASMYPVGRLVLSEDEMLALAQKTPEFTKRHMQHLLQSLVLEMMCAGRYSDSLALMSRQVRALIDEFRSERLTLDKTSPNKTLYDSVRILGLQIAAQLDRNLILLSKAPGDAALKSEVVRSIIQLCFNSSILKQTDPHFEANLSSLGHSKGKFTDIIDQAGLAQDFDTAIAYLN